METLTTYGRDILSSQDWASYFAYNAKHLYDLDYEHARPLTKEEADLVFPSIRMFEVGEGSEGKNLLAAASIYAQGSGDTTYPEAMRWFVREENRHSRTLKRYMDAHGVVVSRHVLLDRVFRWLRRGGSKRGQIKPVGNSRCPNQGQDQKGSQGQSRDLGQGHGQGQNQSETQSQIKNSDSNLNHNTQTYPAYGAALEREVTVLVTAEMIALCYYDALGRSINDPLLTRICEQMLHDELRHVVFQSGTLYKLGQTQASERRRRRLMRATCRLIWLACKRVFRAGGYSKQRFYDECMGYLEQSIHIARTGKAPMAHQESLNGNV